MKKYLVFFFVFILFNNLSARESFKESRSTHFIVFYNNAPEDFIKSLLDKAEFYYGRITEDLGFKRFNFWLWDNRAKIYIYDDAKAYQAASGQPAWSGGAAMPNHKIIQSFPASADFLDTILPHEMGHIIFREFVGFNNPGVALWLDEGVASYQEKIRYSQADEFIRRLIDRGDFINLKKLSSYYTLTNLDSGIIDIFYAQSYSIVDFLIKRFGRDKFVLFCQNLRDYRNLEDALRLTYSFQGISQLERAWVDYLRK
ncbi:MAG: peptidase MA family metallohydrolase [Candidatus Omnitrophica bacterium]|jgi:hypothetical protein|nr:peptidase MA family metallohydrolase [Candidatus Omnitrophota bacterium]MDD3987874.1 peptidase MA family metallohydrolase [Candidatus Omnitrophota bacterium]